MIIVFCCLLFRCMCVCANIFSYYISLNLSLYIFLCSICHIHRANIKRAQDYKSSPSKKRREAGSAAWPHTDSIEKARTTERRPATARNGNSHWYVCRRATKQLPHYFDCSLCFCQLSFMWRSHMHADLCKCESYADTTNTVPTLRFSRTLQFI